MIRKLFQNNEKEKKRLEVVEELNKNKSRYTFEFDAFFRKEIRVVRKVNVRLPHDTIFVVGNPEATPLKKIEKEAERILQKASVACTQLIRYKYSGYLIEERWERLLWTLP